CASAFATGFTPGSVCSATDGLVRRRCANWSPRQQFGVRQMRFLERDETSSLEKKLRQQIADKPKPKTILYYDSGNRDYSRSANAIAGATGGFSEAALLFLFCATGDGWNEICAGNEQWRLYRQWRTAHGEDRRLYDAPGHLFAPHEVKQLSEAVDFSLQLGW